MVIKVNPAFERLTGLSAIRCLGSSIGTLTELGGIINFITGDVSVNKASVKYFEGFRGRDILVFVNQVYDENGKLTNSVIIFKDLVLLCQLIENLQRTKKMAGLYIEEPADLMRKYNGEDIIVNSEPMKRVINLALKIAKVDSTVLVTGETGVGKEIVARIIHKCSQRVSGSFIKLNCGAIPEALLEAELFGYEAGSFTGARDSGKQGLIEMADKGTLFLDEIGDLPMNVQVKLLRVLQEREILRIGGTSVKKVDFRLITATGKDLRKMVSQRRFREDLFYRLNVVPVQIPTLKERKDDILPLAIYFLHKFNKKYKMSRKLAPVAIERLLEYNWPGNVRELENTIERLVVTSETNFILAEGIAVKKHDEGTSAGGKQPVLSLRNMLDQTEKNLLLQTVGKYRTTREMAEALGISQSAVVKKMQKYGIVITRLSG